jgi:hypothetical protein
MIDEDRLRQWAQPPSDTETTKADNAERIIRETLTAAPALRALDLRVFTQGSYKAKTNTRQNSDVDVCVLCRDTFFYDLSTGGLTNADVSLAPATLLYPQFRSMVEEVLVKRFGREGVTRGSKAFDVHANSYRLDADVVVAFEHRRYQRLPNGNIEWLSGIEFAPDLGRRIINWPDQAYDNGVEKNTRTGKRYKAAIRVLKRLRDCLQDEHEAAANEIGSFLIECLVWNVPDDHFESSTLRGTTQNVLAFLWNEAREDASCSEWGEVSDLKYVLRGSPGLRERVHAFCDSAWNYIGFPNS